MAQLVCMLEIPAAELKPGHIVISGDRARYLGEKTRQVCGYDEWTYTAYQEGGEVASRGIVNLRHDGTARIVAVHVDGGVVVP